MPELPEVETVRLGLADRVIGRIIIAEMHDTEKGFPNAPVDVKNFLLGATITGVRRRAKVLMIDLSTGYSLIVHLKMTGQLVFVSPDDRFGAGHPNDSLINTLPDKSTRVTLSFKDGAALYFNDQRKFGWMKLIPTAEIPSLSFMQKVGPEPLDASFTKEAFKERFTRRKKTSIKAALLDQSVVAGIGNIYADEALWGAKVHPTRKVETITEQEFTDLYNEVRAVMSLAIEKGGSSNHTYVNAEGKKGSYMDFARAFRREGLPCPRCGTIIEKIRVAGRGTHICPHCQVL
ncbi:bifunctional DNA-formamidopyrimidine glycosylase/DNA-(apurinic or apyrimidinic site) lyase [Candidatus Saccharibacteria bacterium TM7i]|nr:bifunctional DNA-formamidopyrimidine glycosylase/DNA-(apurinic or apyrimidinic site) lyase [Candidatus Saccharibacteria bacterium TM7i]